MSCPAHKTRHIAVLLGSLRKHSCNQRVAKVLDELAPRSLRLEIVEISRLSPFTGDRNDPPAEWRVFQRQIRAADGVLFLTPEYPRIMPNVLRNALSIAAHAPERNAWEGKPGGVVSVAPNVMGRAGSNRRLCQALTKLNVPVMQQPDLFISDADSLFDATGRLINPATRQFLANYMNAFNNWIHTNCRH